MNFYNGKKHIGNLTNGVFRKQAKVNPFYESFG